MKHRLLLLTPLEGEALSTLVSIFRGSCEIIVVRDRAALDMAAIDDGTSLLAFGSWRHSSRSSLRKAHAPCLQRACCFSRVSGPRSTSSCGVASREKLRRDASRYDSSRRRRAHCRRGPIYVSPGETPQQLLDRANVAALRLVKLVGARSLDREPLPALHDVAWDGPKTTRADFLEFTRLSALIDGEEFERRFHAFDGGAHNNLTLDFHGRTFRIDKGTSPHASIGSSFADFTEAAYRDLLAALKAGNYQFARFGDGGADRHVLWRHDVDFSVHRAVRVAEIEGDQGLVATYFLNPRSIFYNLLEPGMSTLVRRIVTAGHEIGLHFDGQAQTVTRWMAETLEEAVIRERKLIETILDIPVRTISWHNPDLSNLLHFQSETIGGLINSYSARLRRDYVYGSDSNGYWRFKPMGELITEGHARLHLLTHPEWWTPEPLPPSARIDRAIIGRAHANRRDYDSLLLHGGKKHYAMRIVFLTCNRALAEQNGRGLSSAMQ